jgi:hypothetical protein
MMKHPCKNNITRIILTRNDIKNYKKLRKIKHSSIITNNDNNILVDLMEVVGDN